MRQSQQFKANQFKREKTERCELCSSQFTTLRKQHQCKRCLRAVCSDCSKSKEVILKIQHIDKKKHRLCDICKKDASNQKKIRDENKLKFATDSQVSTRWVRFISTTQSSADIAVQFNQALTKSIDDLKDYANLYEQQRMGLNYSWFDMLAILTEKVDKKVVQETVRRVLHGVLSTTEVGFKQGMIDLAYYLLAYCSESSAYFVMSKIYSSILPDYLQPRNNPTINTNVDDDISFINEILETTYKVNVKDLNSCRGFLNDNYIALAQQFLANSLMWEGFSVYFETLLSDNNFYPLQNCLALMCSLSIKSIVNDQPGVAESMLKTTNDVRVREFLQQQKNDRMKTVSMQRSLRISRIDKPEEEQEPPERHTVHLVNSSHKILKEKVQEDTESSSEENDEGKPLKIRHKELKEKYEKLTDQFQERFDELNSKYLASQEDFTIVEQQNKQLQDLVDSSQNVEAKLNVQIEEHKERINEISKDFELLESKYDEQWKQYNALKKENEVLKLTPADAVPSQDIQDQTNQAWQLEKQELQKQIDKSQNIVNTSERTIESLNEAVKSTSNEASVQIADLKNQVHQLQNAINEKELEIVKRQSAYDQIQLTVNELQLQLNRNVTEKDHGEAEWQLLTSDLRTQLSNSNQRANSLESELLQLQNKVNTEVSQLAPTIQQLQAALTSQVEIITSKDTVIQELQNKFQQAQNRFEDLGVEKQKIGDQAKEQALLFRQMQDQLDQQRQTSLADREQIRLLESNSSSQTREIMQSVENLQAQLISKDNTLNQLSQSLSELEQDLQAQRQLALIYQSQLESSQADRDSKEEANQNLLKEREAQIQEQIHRNNELEVQLTHQGLKLQVAQEQFELTKLSLSNAQLEITQARLEHDQTNQNLTEARQQISEKSQQLNKLQDQFVRLDESQTRLSNEFDSYRSTAESETARLVDELANLTKKTVDQANDIHAKLDTIHQLQRNNGELHKQYESSKSALEAKDLRIGVLEQENRQSQQSNISLQNRVNELSSAIEQIKQQIKTSNATDSIEQLLKVQHQEEVSQLILQHTQALQDLQFLADSHSQELQQKSDLITDLNKQRQELESQIAVLLKQIQDGESEIGGVQEHVKQVEKRNHDLLHRLHQEEKTIENLRKIVADLEKQKLGEEGDFSQKLNEMEIELETKDEEKEQLKHDLERKIHDLERILLVTESREQDIKSAYRVLEKHKEQLEVANRQLEAKVEELKILNSSKVASQSEQQALLEEIKSLNQINGNLIERMTKMNMDIVEEIQFVRSYKPKPEELSAIGEVLRTVDPKSGPLMQSIHFILVTSNGNQQTRITYDMIPQSAKHQQIIRKPQPSQMELKKRKPARFFEQRFLMGDWVELYKVIVLQIIDNESQGIQIGYILNQQGVQNRSSPSETVNFRILIYQSIVFQMFFLVVLAVASNLLAYDFCNIPIDGKLIELSKCTIDACSPVNIGSIFIRLTDVVIEQKNCNNLILQNSSIINLQGQNIYLIRVKLSGLVASRDQSEFSIIMASGEKIILQNLEFVNNKFRSVRPLFVVAQFISVHDLSFTANEIIHTFLFTTDFPFQTQKVGVLKVYRFTLRNNVFCSTPIMLVDLNGDKQPQIWLANTTIHNNTFVNIFGPYVNETQSLVFKELLEIAYGESAIFRLKFSSKVIITGFTFSGNIINWYDQLQLFQLERCTFYLSELFIEGNQILSMEFVLIEAKSNKLLLKNIIFTQQRVRNTSVIVLMMAEYVQNLASLATQNNEELKRQILVIAGRLCQRLQTAAIINFPIFGLMLYDVSLLNLKGLSIDLSQVTGFRVVYLINLKVVSEIKLTNILVFRSFKNIPCDFGILNINGMYNEIVTEKMKIVRLNFGSQNLVAITIQKFSTSDTGYRINFRKISIFDTVTTQTDPSSQITLFLIYNDRFSTITMEDLTIVGLKVINIIRYASNQQNKHQNICTTNAEGSSNNSNENLDVVLEDQTLVLLIQSPLSRSFLSRFYLHNILAQSPISYLIKVDNLECAMKYITIYGFRGKSINEKSIVDFVAQKYSIKNMNFINLQFQQFQLLGLTTKVSKGEGQLYRMIIYNIRLEDFQYLVKIESSNITFICQGLLITLNQNAKGIGFLMLNTQQCISKVLFQSLQIINWIQLQEQVFGQPIYSLQISGLAILKSFKFSDIKIFEEDKVGLFLISISSDSSFLNQILVKNVRRINQVVSMTCPFDMVVINLIIINCDLEFQLNTEIMNFYQFQRLMLINIHLTSLEIISQVDFFNYREGIFIISGDKLQKFSIIKNVLCNAKNINKTQIFWIDTASKVLMMKIQLFNSNNLLMVFLQNSLLMLTNSIFTNLNYISTLQQKINGPIVYSTNSIVLIQNSIFHAITGGVKGGVLYLDFDRSQFDNDFDYRMMMLIFKGKILFSYCKAEVGGAIYDLSSTLWRNIKNAVVIKCMDSRNLFNYIARYPDEILITTKQSHVIHQQHRSRIQQQITQDNPIIIKNVRRGAKIEFFLQLLEESKIHFLQDMHLQEFNFIKKNGSYMLPTKITLSDKLFDSFEIPTQMFTMSKNSILREFNLYITLVYRECIPGEFRVPKKCDICKPMMYSITSEAEQCAKCPNQAICSDGKLNRLIEGFWRPDLKTDIIVFCDRSLEACQENILTHSQCIEGYYGPKCEKCDVYGMFSPNSYHRTEDYKCSSCTQGYQPFLYSIIFVVLQLFVLIFQLMLTYQANIQQCLIKYIGYMDFLPFGVSGLFNTDVYIKTLIFHVQTLSMIRMFSQDVGIRKLIETQGLAFKTQDILIHQTDCAMQYLNLNLELPSSAFMDIILSLLFSTFGIMAGWLSSTLKRRLPFFKSFVIMYVFWIQLPQTLYFVAQAVACKELLGKYMLKLDLDNLCMGSIQLKYLYFLVIPILIIVLLTISMIFRNLLYSRDSSSVLTDLRSISTLAIYGMIFKEYKSSFCFFDFIKLTFKIILIFLINLLDDDRIFMAFLMSIVICSYYLTTKNYLPFIYHRTQSFDEMQTITLVITIQTLMLSNHFDNRLLQLCLDVPILFINGLLLLGIFQVVFEAYTLELDLKSRLIRLKVKYPSFGFFIRSSQRSIAVLYHWQILKKSVWRNRCTNRDSSFITIVIHSYIIKVQRISARTKG